jgi:hypothetical protein
VTGRRARALVSALGLIAATAPALAHACPSCATREGLGGSVLALLAGMIVVPYAIAAVTIRVVRRLSRPDRDGERP